MVIVYESRYNFDPICLYPLRLDVYVFPGLHLRISDLVAPPFDPDPLIGVTRRSPGHSSHRW